MLENDNVFASDDAFSGQDVPETNNKENEGIAPKKKAAAKKASKVADQPDDASKGAIKKAATKKASVKKAETAEPKPARVKKAAAAKKTQETQPEADQVAAAAKKATAVKKAAVKKAAPAKKAAAKKAQASEQLSFTDQDVTSELPFTEQPVTTEQQPITEPVSAEHEAAATQPVSLTPEELAGQAGEQQPEDAAQTVTSDYLAPMEQPEVDHLRATDDAPQVQRDEQTAEEQALPEAEVSSKQLSSTPEPEDVEETEASDYLAPLEQVDATNQPATGEASQVEGVEAPTAEIQSTSQEPQPAPGEQPETAQPSVGPDVTTVEQTGEMEQQPMSDEMQIQDAESPAEELQSPAEEQPVPVEEPVSTEQQPVAEQPLQVTEEKQLPVNEQLASEEQSAISSLSSQGNEEALKIETDAPVQEASLLSEGDTGFSFSGKKAALRKITFQVRFSTVLGQSIYVTGSHYLLGKNDPQYAFPLSYLNQEYWIGTLEIPEGETFDEVIPYRYVLKNADGSISPEWGGDKLIEPLAYGSEEVLLIDSWNPSYLIENTYYTEPFQEVLLRANFTEVETKQPEKVTHIFRAKAPLLSKGQALCIAGSVAELGEWDTENPMLLSSKPGQIWHTVAVDLSGASFPVFYKYGVYDINDKKFVQFESGPNRVLHNTATAETLTVVSDGFAQLPSIGFKGAGVAIPVFSLRSEKSFGVGEFTDIKLLVDWARQVGLKLIQLLPVNDTTATHQYTDSYPYAAISAFALHPLYLHIPAILNGDDQSVLSKINEKQAELNSKPEVDYVGVMSAKWDLLHQIFPSQKEATFNSPGFIDFFNENAHWLVPYAAFSYFREKYNTSDFNKWATNQTYNAAEINALASSPLEAEDQLSIYYYVQYHLHLQLTEAVNYAHSNCIIIKGDIPIGIYRYSCDAWQDPQFFNMEMQAGAPPDDFAIKGQNWGFPTYNWHRMREDGFSWWKKRFTQMSYYFDAFRIDHILGFFRIWSIPMESVEGIMGYFVPAVPVYINEITGRGIPFNHDRFCKPYINDIVLTEIFDGDGDVVKSQFLQTSGNGTYTLKPEFNTQRKVEAHFQTLESTTENKKIKQGLYDLISNVILFEIEGTEGQQFHFRIDMDETISFKHLDGHSKYLLQDLYVNYFYRRQDSYWMKEAMLKLPELKRSTNMLICGEDLGMVPDCVPVVMKELAILSLEIQRMPKDPSREFFHPNDAPFLSVVTPSTHDMSTIRGWWEENRVATQRFFNYELGQWGTAPYFCEPWIARMILEQHFYSPAMWSIFQLQDLLSISSALRRENPHEERINIPADPKHYWRYRMHLSLERLLNESEFTSELRRFIQQSGRG